MIGFAFLLLSALQLSEIREIIIEVRALGRLGMNRLAMLATVPFYMCFGLFFTILLRYSYSRSLLSIRAYTRCQVWKIKVLPPCQARPPEVSQHGVAQYYDNY
jgi:hypothetical protein